MENTHPIDELLDLVDENDQVIGQKKRSEIYKDNLTNFRVINAFLINSKGQLWIPRRATNKRIFPLCLDMSIGGHVETGESYDDAFRRELKEELNLDSDYLSVKLLGNLTPEENNVSAFMNVYEIHYDQSPDYNNNDFIEYSWLFPGELIEKISKGEKAKSDLPKLVKFFYLNKAVIE